MTLNLTQLKDLEFICEIAESYYPKERNLADQWLKRIRMYRTLLQNAMAKELSHGDEEPGEQMIEAGWLKATEMGATGPVGLQDQKAMFILGFRIGWRDYWATH